VFVFFFLRCVKGIEKSWSGVVIDITKAIHAFLINGRGHLEAATYPHLWLLRLLFMGKKGVRRPVGCGPRRVPASRL
jgi:hypothetical protein